jgi:hypothetical protein
MFVKYQTYTIISVGTTDFTAIGASANNVGVTFVATGAGSGTGTAKTTAANWTIPFVTGATYFITSVGTTDFTLIGAANNNVGTGFVATGPGTGTGTALTSNFKNDANTGFYSAVAVWTQIAWDTQDPGVSSPFTDFSLLPAPIFGQPGYGFLLTPFVTNCVNLTVAPFQCASNVVGAINARPNASFTGTNVPITASFRYNQGGNPDKLPVVPPAAPVVGSNWTVWDIGGSDQGVWTYDGTGSGPPVGYTQGTPYVYNPGLINTGAALGAQAPIATHDGNAWSNPPNVGAY